MDKAFKVTYGETPAAVEQLDAIEEIVVEQEIGKAWEARIKIAVCISEDGVWEGETDAAYVAGARVRIEAQIGDGDFVPLIDGEIQRHEPDYNAVPGSSVRTLVVHDDTQKLHKEAGSDSYPGKSDSEIVNSIFKTAALGNPPVIDPITGARPDANAVINRHGTMMEMLRSIAARYTNYHAYVLPGPKAGTSIGCFKKLPENPDLGLPTMFLTGPGQNISGFNIQENAAKATNVVGSHLSMSNKKVTTATAGPADSKPPAGDSATSDTSAVVRTRRLPPGIGDHTGFQEAAEGAAQESAFTLRGEGSVIPACYSAVLSPYKMVFVSVSNSRYSTNYVIYKVVHTLGISEYTQQFMVIGKTVSPEESLSASVPAAAAVLGINFNAQVDIF